MSFQKVKILLSSADGGDSKPPSLTVSLVESAQSQRLRRPQSLFHRHACRYGFTQARIFSSLYGSTVRSISLLYMPPGDMEAMVHYQNTIRNRVGSERIATHIPPSLARKLQQVFGSHPIASRTKD